MQKTKLSLSSQIVLTLAACFLVMFAVLFGIFSLGMNSMLDERETENMYSQTDLVGVALAYSLDSLPSATKEWATLTYMYDYVLGTDDRIYYSHFVQDSPYDINKINILAVIDAENNILFERFYSYAAGETLQHDDDLSSMYAYLAEVCRNKFFANEQTVGKDGLFTHNGHIYYLSAYPVVNRSANPPVGTFFFGRIIDEEEISTVMADSKVDFTVLSREDTKLDAAVMDSLSETGKALYIAEDNSVIAYSTVNDLFDEPSILVSVSDTRSLKSNGQVLIRQYILYVALGCILVLLLIITLMRKVIIKPISKLVGDLEEIDPDKTENHIAVTNTNRDMYNLTTAVSNMLQLIIKDRNLIKKNNESLYYSANFDSLTGLSNRINATESLVLEMKAADKDDYSICVYYFDINRFKIINDTIGHNLGNEVIVEIAKRMQSSFSQDNILARMNGDEFIICMKNIDDDEKREHFANKIFKIFDEPFQIRHREIDVSVSIGSSLYPADAKTVDRLIKNAELAMYHAKETNCTKHVAYTKSLRSNVQQKLDIENRLRDVIRNNCNEFEVYLQPKLEISNSSVDKCEALLRWNAPTGMVFPDNFIPQAEESGLIVPMTWWLIDECCRQCRLFADNGNHIVIAINTPEQVLIHEDFIPLLIGSAKRHGVSPSCLEIEITERTLLNDMERVEKVLETLHDLDIEVSVDDFGTGYSSLNYLSKLSVDRIKIDKSFIAMISEETKDTGIVDAIIAMAKSLKMIVTAEGVETLSQYHYLREKGCDEIQGYLICRPIAAADFLLFHKQWQKGEILPPS